MCLPANPGTRSNEPFAGWEAVATGWGSTVDRGSRFPDTLMEVPVTVMADQDCRRRFGVERIQEYVSSCSLMYHTYSNIFAVTSTFAQLV